MNQTSRKKNGAVAVFLTTSLVLMLVVTGEAQNTRPAVPPQANATRVLFMCPHGAAKSVLASAYFQRLAKERGLNVIVDSAGRTLTRLSHPRSPRTSPSRVIRFRSKSLVS